MKTPDSLRLYAGTYTSSGGEGIHVFTLDGEDGTLRPISVYRNTQDTSFLVADAEGRRLYAVNELMEFEGQPGGSVSAFSVAAEDGSLAFMNRQASRGAAPCHLSLEPVSRTLWVANYGGGNLAALPLSADGSLQAAAAVFQHQGRGHDAERQAGPHLHCVMPDPAGRRVLAVDLGLDTLTAYPCALDARGASRPVVTPLEPGTGPRQIAFHPRGRFAYVLNELKPTLDVFAYDGVTGELTRVQTLPVLPPDFSGVSYGAHLQFSPDGKFLYASTRGHDSLAAFALESTGRLTLLRHFSTQGAFPRHFTFDPEGRFLYVANQRSNTIGVFRVDSGTGNLHSVGSPVAVAAPACLRVLRLPR